MTEAKVERRHRQAVAFLVRGHARTPGEMVNWVQAGDGLPGKVSGRALLDEFAQALASAEAAGRQGAEWIPCSERMPPLGVTVIVLRMNMAEPIAAQLDDDGDWVDAATHEVRGVTHWVPLPSKPGGPP